MKHRNKNRISNFFYTVLATVFIVSCTTTKSNTHLKHTTTHNNIDSILPLNNTNGYLKEPIILEILKDNR
jgi:hypothetical protein